MIHNQISHCIPNNAALIYAWVNHHTFCNHGCSIYIYILLLRYPKSIPWFFQRAECSPIRSHNWFPIIIYQNMIIYKMHTTKLVHGSTGLSISTKTLVTSHLSNLVGNYLNQPAVVNPIEPQAIIPTYINQIHVRPAYIPFESTEIPMFFPHGHLVSQAPCDWKKCCWWLWPDWGSERMNCGTSWGEMLGLRQAMAGLHQIYPAWCFGSS